MRVKRGSRRLYLVLTRIVLILFALLVLFLPLLYVPPNYFLVAMLLILSILAILVKTRAIQTIYTFVIKHPVIILFCAALVVRIVSVLIISPRTVQISDFGGAYLDSLSDTPTSHVPLWPHFIMYPYILHFFAEVFGSSPVVGGIFNAVVGALSVVLAYGICSQIINKKTGVTAALFLGFWPGAILYTTIYTPDHATVLFILLAVFTFIKAVRDDRLKFRALNTLACLASILCLSFFKDAGIILLLAFAGFVFLSAIKERGLKSQSNNIYIILTFLIVFSVAGGFLTRHITSSVAGRPLNPSAVSYWLMTGLGANNNGAWEEGVYSHYENLMRESGYDFDVVNQQMMRDAVGKIAERTPYLPLTLFNKGRELSAHDEAKIEWVAQSADQAGSLAVSETLRGVLNPINGVFFAMIVVSMCFAVVRQWSLSGSNSGLFLLIILLLGVFCVFLILEVQNRYRYIVEPIYCIIAAYGLHAFDGCVMRTVRRKRTRNNKLR